jgi:hypothetical protein
MYQERSITAMQRGFTKGMVIGGLIATSVSMIMNSDKMNPGTRRRMMRNGRNFLRKSGNIIEDVVDIFR